jgi:hypothetical protein
METTDKQIIELQKETTAVKLLLLITMTLLLLGATVINYFNWVESEQRETAIKTEILQYEIFEDQLERLDSLDKKLNQIVGKPKNQ